jgi:hypothetical protein
MCAGFNHHVIITWLPVVLFLQIKSTFSSKLLATGVVVLVPVPENTSKATILVTAGRAKYDATKKALVWKVCASHPQCL